MARPNVARRMSLSRWAAFPALYLVLLIALIGIGHLVLCLSLCPYISPKRAPLIESQTLKVFMRPAILVSLLLNLRLMDRTQNYFVSGLLPFSDLVQPQCKVGISSTKFDTVVAQYCIGALPVYIPFASEQGPVVTETS